MKRASKKRTVRWKYAILLTTALLVIGLDQLSKFWITDHFHLGQTLSLIVNFLNITYVQNRGAAFGLLAQTDPAFRGPFFIIVPLVALGTIAYVFRKIPDGDRKLAVSLSLVIAGALGNLYDRLSLGYVVDFIDFHWHWGYHFPAFNVADSAICIGVALLMIDLIAQDLTHSPKKRSRSHASSTS